MRNKKSEEKVKVKGEDKENWVKFYVIIPPKAGQNAKKKILDYDYDYDYDL
jgi:hypothetical protein